MVPLIVNTSDPMAKVRVVTTKDYSTKTLKALHSAGVLHVEESEELKPIDKEAIERQRRKTSELLTNINEVLAYLPKGERVSLAEDVEVIYTKPFDEVDSEVSLLCTKLTKMHQIAAKLRENVRELMELGRYLGALGQQVDIKLRDLNFSGGYLFSRVFVFPNELFETLFTRLREHLFENIVATAENETVLHAIARIEDRETIETIVRDGGGKILQIPEKNLTVKEFLEAASGSIRTFEEQLAKLHTEIETKTRENLEKLVLFREALSAETERLAVLAKACEARYVTLIEGWIPEASAEDMIPEIKDKVDYVFIDTRKPEQTEDPPTKMRNATALKPFEVIVNLFGTPKYREWDPTPIIAYFFAIFFGIMLGDVVYAALLMLFAYRGLQILVDNPESEGFKLFQRIVYISGGVALVVGLLTGSYLGNFYEFFGIESLTLAIFSRVQEIFSKPVLFIQFSLVIGIVHINIAHVLALIRGIKERQKGIVPNKVGLFMLEIGAIPLIMRFILDMNIPWLTGQIPLILLFIAATGLVLIVLSSLMEKGAFLGGIFWLFDVTGLLGDIMSYARLAGVGLATYYLAYCFNLMADLLYGMMPAGIVQLIVGSLIFILVLLIGHVLNLALSGITCFVHSLRLCFVEFLFKFYEGGGRAYSPFRLKKRPVSVKV
jgi:V/A-type H+-transporting ATPase subunit I